MATTGFVGHKTPMLGFAIQSALGTAASVATMVFPLRNGTDLKPKRTKEFYQGNAGNQERAHYYTKSLITEGTIDVPLVPGMLAATSPTSGSDLYSWLFVRDASDPYQGKYATLFEYLGNEEYWIFPDCKCTGGGLKIESGNTVDLSIKALGGGVPTAGASGNFPAYSSGVWMDGKPYTFDQATVQLGYTTSTYATDQYTKSHAPEWDNMVMGADAASMIVYGRLGPYALPNLGRAQWKGSFNRFFFDDDILDAYMSGTTEGAYKITLQGGGVTGTLAFPRIVFSDGGWPSLPGDDVVMYDGVAFEALGGLGVPGTPCFTWTEQA
jgi:hypothetical protein